MILYEIKTTIVDQKHSNNFFQIGTKYLCFQRKLENQKVSLILNWYELFNDDLYAVMKMECIAIGRINYNNVWELLEGKRSTSRYAVCWTTTFPDENIAGKITG